METANKEVRGNRPKTQGGEGQGQPRTGNSREGYRDANGHRIREIKSIRGGGEKATRWEKITKINNRCKNPAITNKGENSANNEDRREVGENKTRPGNNDTRTQHGGGFANYGRQAGKEQRTRDLILKEQKRRELNAKQDRGSQVNSKAKRDEGTQKELKSRHKQMEKKDSDLKKEPKKKMERGTKVEERGGEQDTHMSSIDDQNKGFYKRKKKKDSSDKEERDTLNFELQGQTKKKNKQEVPLKERRVEVPGDSNCKGACFTDSAKQTGNAAGDGIEGTGLTKSKTSRGNVGQAGNKGKGSKGNGGTHSNRQACFTNSRQAGRRRDRRRNQGHRPHQDQDQRRRSRPGRDQD